MISRMFLLTKTLNVRWTM